MKRLNRSNVNNINSLPIKVIQFGGGNFLRGFADYVIDKMNNKANFDAGVVVIKPTPGKGIEPLNEQNGLYNLFLKGIKNGKKVEQTHTISCIQKGINPYEDYEEYLMLAEKEELEILLSNTTEAGITYDGTDKLHGYPHKSFPAKVTALLYRRFVHFKGNPQKGLTVIPCELIDRNADTLKAIILNYAELWGLSEDFKQWIEKANSFHNTLVDRIVPGYPKDDLKRYQDELDYEDKLIVSAEVFLLWVIEGDEKLKEKIPFDKIGEDILIVKDIKPYKTRKIRILNGAHTTMVPFSLLYGNKTVKETLDNNFTGNFIRQAVFEEIIPILSLPKKELDVFAKAVFDRFQNPFIKHQLSSIALNSISKFKVRVLPSLLDFQQKFNTLPSRLTFAFACLIRFYDGKWKGACLPVQDDKNIISTMNKLWENPSYQEITKKVLSKIEYWEKDLTKVPGLKEQIAYALSCIDTKGIEGGYEAFSEKFQSPKK